MSIPLRFFDIPKIIQNVLDTFVIEDDLSVEGLFNVDKKVKDYTIKLIYGE